MFASPPDGSTYEGAKRHAQLIAAYWAKRGFNVLPTVVDTGTRLNGGKVPVFGVRSDMVNGQPQRRK